LPDLQEWKHPGYGPMHLWVRCINYEMRGFLYHEPIELGSLQGAARMDTDPFPTKANISIDGQQVSVRSSMVGAELYHKFDPMKKEIIIEIVGWLHFLSFQPDEYCTNKEIPPLIKSDTPLSSIAMNVQPNYIMHIWNWDDILPPNDSKFHRIISFTANNFLYHSCLLKLKRFQIVIRRGQLEYYLKHPVIRQGVANGLIYFFIKGNHPAMVKSLNCNWQAIYENVAILRYWKEDVRIIFSDIDEYFYVPPEKLPYFNQMNYYHSRVLFGRSDLFCADCVDSAHGLGKSFLSSHSFLRVPDAYKILGKNIIDPNRVCCQYVHHSNFAESTLWFNSNISFIMHFQNLIQPRVNVDSKIHPGLVPFNISAVSECEPTHQLLLHDHNHRKKRSISQTNLSIIPGNGFGLSSASQSVFRKENLLLRMNEIRCWRTVGGFGMICFLLFMMHFLILRRKKV
jgi:hypothetical protein